MVIYSTLVNKATASRLYFKEFLSNLDLDNSRGEGSGTYNTAPKPNIIVICISSALAIYTKV
jgi:hypothetical protein